MTPFSYLNLTFLKIFDIIIIENETRDMQMYHSRLVSSPDKTEVVGPSPTICTKLAWTAGPLKLPRVGAGWQTLLT